MKNPHALTNRGRLFGGEEIPRWFGFSLVVICCAGIGAVAWVSARQAHEEFRSEAEQSRYYALKQLARTLANVDEGESDVGLSLAWERHLRELRTIVSVSNLRVVDSQRKVAASIDPKQIGTTAPSIPIAQLWEPFNGAIIGGTWGSASPAIDRKNDSKAADPPVHWIRIPIVRAVPSLPPSSTSPPSSATSPSSSVTSPSTSPLPSSSLSIPSEGVPSESSASSAQSSNASAPSEQPPDGSAQVATSAFFLESAWPQTHVSWLDVMARIPVLAITLAVLAALLVAYRGLRQHVRGLSRIGRRLSIIRGHINQDLQALRISDAQDMLTQAWNELIEAAQEWRQAMDRSDAAEELIRALQRNNGSTLAESLNVVPDGIMLITNEVNVDYYNAAVARLMGWEHADGVTPALTDAVIRGAGNTILKTIRDTLRPDGSFEVRTEFVELGDGPGDHDGTGTFRVQILPLQKGRMDGSCVVIIRDVSQQVRADRAREDFVAQVTHEFRTPLTNIRAYTETLSSGMFDDPKVISECYNVITKETRRLSRLVEDILSVSQLEVGSIELTVDNVDLRTLLSDGVQDVRGLADEKNIDLQLVLPAKMEPIRGDRDKLAIVVNNLLGNAIKYTLPEGNVVVGCQYTPKEVVITFKDNGIGIAPSEHASVFEKFSRGSDPQVQKQSGTGIGLFTAREIVRHHGGNIELMSQKGHGTTFMVRLPHQESRAATFSLAQNS